MVEISREIPDGERTGALAIVVIDDHEIVFLGVQHAFSEAGVSADFFYADSVHKVPTPLRRPAVAVLDLRLHDGSRPAESLGHLHRLGLPTVVYTSADNPVLVREAIGAGALAVVRKSAPPANWLSPSWPRPRGGRVPGWTGLPPSTQIGISLLRISRRMRRRFLLSMPRVRRRNRSLDDSHFPFTP